MRGHVDAALPDKCPQGFTQGDCFPRWVRTEDDAVNIQLGQNDILFSGYKTLDVDAAMIDALARCRRLGLPEPIELEVVNLVAQFESGILNPTFHEASKFDTQRIDRLAQRIKNKTNGIERRQKKIADLRARPLRPSQLEQRTQCISRLERQIQRANELIQSWTKKLDRKLAFRVRTLTLANGKVCVFNNGNWVFTGQKSMEQVHEDHAEASRLVLPPVPAIQGLNISE